MPCAHGTGRLVRGETPVNPSSPCRGRSKGDTCAVASFVSVPAVKSWRKSKTSPMVAVFRFPKMMRRAGLGVRMPSRTLDATHIILLTRILAELSRMGGNLNQMVRRANAGKLVGHDAELTGTLACINTLRDRLREFLA